MIVNPDVVDIYTSLKKRKHPKNAKKQQPTDNKRTSKYQCVNERGPVFTFSFPGGGLPLSPRQLLHCVHPGTLRGVQMVLILVFSNEVKRKIEFHSNTLLYSTVE